MVDMISVVHRLRDATTRVEVLHALWDLRDSAYDRPQLWRVLTAETLFQSLAEVVDDGDDGVSANRLLAHALERARANGVR